MAKDVRVTISGQETVSNAAKSASTGLDNLLKAALGLTGANAALQIMQKIGEELQNIKKFVSECIDEYALEEKAVLSLNAAMAASPVTNGQASATMVEFAKSMSTLTGETVAQVEAMETLLITSGRTETQTQQIIRAASDLAVATGTDVNSAVQKLNATYDGTLSRMDRMFPDLKNLTKAQLENGDAVAVIESHVHGMSEALANSTDVSLKNYKNAWSELKGAVGENVSSFFTPMRNALSEMVQGWADNVEQLNKYKQALKDLASQDAIRQVQAKIEIATEQIATDLTAQKSARSVYALDSYPQYLMQNGMQDTPDSKKNFNNANADLLDKFNKILNADTKNLSDLGVQLAQLQKANGAAPSGSGTGGTVNADNNADLTNKLQALLDSYNLKEIMLGNNKLAELQAEEKIALDEIKKEFAENNDDYNLAFTAVEEYFKNAEAAEKERLRLARLAATTKDVSTGTGSEWTNEGHADVIPAGTPTQTQSPNVPAMSTGSSIIDQLMSSFGPLLQSVLPLITSFKSVYMILNPVQTILKGVFDVIGPLVDTILTPLVGILEIVGNTIGKVLSPILSDVLIPIVTFLGNAFVWLYNNVIMNFANGIIGIVNLLSWLGGWIKSLGEVIWDAVTFNWGAISSISNPGALTADMLKQGFLTTISTSDLSSAGAEDSTNDPTNGGNASYSSQRPITNYFTVNTDVMVGDGGWDDFVKMVSKRINELGLTGTL